MFASEPHLSADSLPKSTRLPWNTPAEQRYVELRGRLTRVTGPGAIVISSLVTLSCFRDRRLFTLLLGAQLLQVPFNVWVNLRLLRRVGPKTGERIRNGVNLTVSLVTGHLAHWPLLAWLWLPFVAIAFDHLGVRAATGMIAAFCLGVDALALIDGVPWIYPLSFTAFAILCAQISKV